MKAFQLRYGNLDLKFEKCEFMYAAVKVRPGYIFIHIWGILNKFDVQQKMVFIAVV